jgi:hypothetical protein
VAQSFTADNGITVFDPGTYVETKVIAGQGGIAAAGVVTLVGEADEGPDYTQEQDLDLNSFGPDQIGDVILKYGGGRLVEAFKAVVSASADAAITGSVTAVKLVKTNPSTASTSTVSVLSGSAYATVDARREGAPGNLIKWSSTAAQAEVSPSIPFSYAPTISATDYEISVDGRPAYAVAISAKTSGEALRALIEDGANDLLVTGGDTEAPLTGLTGNLTSTSFTATSITIQLALGSVFATDIEIGDTVVIPALGDYGKALQTSIYAGLGEANVGSYIVTSTANTAAAAIVTMEAISTAGAIVDPVGGATFDEDDILVFKAMQIDHIGGQAKTVKAAAVFPAVDPTWTASLNDGTNVVLGMDGAETWDYLPQLGDTFNFQAAFAGIAIGYYSTVAVTTSSVTLVRESEGSAGGVAGAEGVSVLTAIVTRPVKDGLGKSIEIDTVTTNTESSFYNADTTASSLIDTLVTSASEYVNAFTVARGTSLSDTSESGGDVYISFGNLDKTDAYVTNDGSDLSFYVDSMLDFTASLTQFEFLADMADYVSSQGDWSVALSGKNVTKRSSSLDTGTFGAGSSGGFQPARIKGDTFSFSTDGNNSSIASVSVSATSGLPEESIIPTFLDGGTKAGSTSADFSLALDAVSSVTTNFVVPLVSQDASADAAEGETETSSSYTVDSVNALTRSHAILNSAYKVRQNRIAVASKIGTFLEQQDAAGDLTHFRCGLTFQHVRTTGTDGELKLFQPWMTAVIAVGMQAGAGYKGIVKKFANVSGVVHTAGDYNSKSVTDREKALRAGLLPMESVSTGGYRFTSDQMTYTVDNNFVYNSLQAVYISDLIALTLIQRFDRLVVGQSVADMTASGAKAILQAEMFNFLRLKWISISDDAPAGYKNISVQLRGGVMKIAIEVKLAGLIYFVPINLSISQVTQDA